VSHVKKKWTCVTKGKKKKKKKKKKKERLSTLPHCKLVCGNMGPPPFFA
jgi:hypothetical protein